MDHFSQACGDFGLTISLKKTNTLGKGTEPPVITIDEYELNVVHQFTYLGSTNTNNLSLDTELDTRIGKTATTIARLTTRLLTNPKLTRKTKMAVYNACIISTLLYGSETWTTYARQERRLNTFHIRSLRLLGISWQDKVPNTEVLSRAGLPSIFTLLRQRRLRCLGHARPPHARRPHPQRPPVRRAGLWKTTHRAVAAATPRRRVARHEGCRHQHRVLGETSGKPFQVERSPDQTPQIRSGEAETRSHREVGPQKTKRQSRQTRDRAQVQPCNRDCHFRIGLYSHRRLCSSQAVN